MEKSNEEKQVNGKVDEPKNIRNTFLNKIIFIIIMFFTVFLANIFTIWILSFNAPILEPLLSFDSASENINKEKIKKEKDKKECESNIRLITGAVEMYNMDKEVKMKILDVYKLRDNHYLHNIPTTSDGCHYINVGDLTEKGEIHCVIHGGLKK